MKRLCLNNIYERTKKLTWPNKCEKICFFTYQFYTLGKPLPYFTAERKITEAKKAPELYNNFDPENTHKEHRLHQGKRFYLQYRLETYKRFFTF